MVIKSRGEYRPVLKDKETDKADYDSNKDDTKYITIYSRGSGFHKK